jgi:hypothetical protein
MASRSFADLPDNEAAACLTAIADVFERAQLSLQTIIATDVASLTLRRRLDGAAKAELASAALSERAQELFWLGFSQICEFITQLAVELPGFSAQAGAELLRRDTEILRMLQELAALLPTQRSPEDFDADYRRQLRLTLDRMQLFGVRTMRSSREYGLSIAYLDMTVTPQMPRGFVLPSDQAAFYELVSSRVLSGEDLLSSRPTVITGEAGSGETTLLRWLALQAVQQRSPAGKFTPFFLPMRQYVDRPLPDPDGFIEYSAGLIAAEAPAGWVHSNLRAGTALVLVDGIDELPLQRRGRARDWLVTLITTFKASSFVITSRPEALDEDWFSLPAERRTSRAVQPDYDLDRPAMFRFGAIKPMSAPSVATFIHRWHLAVAAETLAEDEVVEIGQHEKSLIARWNVTGHCAGWPAIPCCAHCCAR